MSRINTLTKYSLPIVLFLIIFIIEITDDYWAYGQPLEGKKQYFVCGIYFMVPHCEFLNNNIEGYLTNGITKKIYSNEMVFVDGIDGKALQFDSAGDVIIIPSYPSLELKDAMTMNLWIKFSDIPIDERIIFVKENTFRLITNPRGEEPGISAFLYTEGGSESKLSLTMSDEEVEKWIMLTITYDTHVDNDNFKLYKNGILTDQKRKIGYIEVNKRWNFVGAMPSGALSLGENIIVQIDNLGIWNRSLTHQEVEQLFNHASNRVEKTELLKLVLNDLIGYWTFENILKDVSGNNNDGHGSTTLISSMIFAPDGRLFFTEKETGKIRILKDDKVLERPFFSIPNIHTGPEQGLLGITLDPEFEENHFVYVEYTYEDININKIFGRVVRFTEVNNIGTDMKIIFDKIPACICGYHIGGALTFGPDDKLYISIGDGGQPEKVQDPSTLVGKILRINKDGTIPSDNPFPNSPVYTIGHRNVFGLAFSKSDDFGIITDNGDVHYDEINKMVKGGNYGFPTKQPPNVSPEYSHDSIKPLRSYWQVIVPAQAIYYDGDKYPELSHKFITTSLVRQGLIAFKFNENNEKIIQEDTIKVVDKGLLVSLAQSPDGTIYFGTDEIYKLEAINTSSKKQIEFPVEIASLGDVKEIQLIPSEKKLLIDFIQLNKSSVATLKIPKSLLGGEITVTDGEKELDFTLDYSLQDYNNIIVPIASNSSHLVIIGTTVVPEFSGFGSLLAFLLALSCVIIFSIKKLSIPRRQIQI